jgi:hypothetical protein
MTDWIEHDGGPQPVAAIGVWVEVQYGDDHDPELEPFPQDPERETGRAADHFWTDVTRFRILNQHRIDAARLESIQLGLEAAFKAADAYDHLAAKAILALDPETIAKETAR